MRILAFPYRGIAYNNSFYDAVEASGMEVVEGPWEGRWLLQNLKNTDVIHIHWPSFLYRPQGSVTSVVKGFIRFLALLFICRIRTRHIWWTAHNLYPHQRSRIPQLDVWARRLLIRLSEGILVHGREAEKLVLKEFPEAKGKTTIIPHGHWIGAYPQPPARGDAREKLGIPGDGSVYLLFGQCQPYKNLITLIRAFKQVAGENDHLIIAGRFSDDDYYQSAAKETDGDSRIRLENGFVPDDDVSVYFAASDVMCLPYSEILTSGSGMLALSYGIPIISIDKGYLREFVPEFCGVLIQDTEVVSVADGMRTARARLWDRSRIVEHARSQTFENAAAIFLKKLRS